MKTYEIPIEWVMINVLTIEAENLEEAVKKAEEKFFKEPLPKDGQYLEDSFQIDGHVFDVYAE